MYQMLLSVNPEHVENILLGKKQYEFRKIRCRPDVDKIIIYARSRKLLRMMLTRCGNKRRGLREFPTLFIVHTIRAKKRQWHTNYAM